MTGKGQKGSFDPGYVKRYLLYDDKQKNEVVVGKGAFLKDYEMKPVLEALPGALQMGKKVKYVALNLRESAPSGFIEAVVVPCLGKLREMGVVLTRIYLESNKLSDQDLKVLWMGVFKPQYEFLEAKGEARTQPRELYLAQNLFTHDSIGKFISLVLQRHNVGGKCPMWMGFTANSCHDKRCTLVDKVREHCHDSLHALCFTQRPNFYCDFHPTSAVHLSTPPSIANNFRCIQTMNGVSTVTLKVPVKNAFFASKNDIAGLEETLNVTASDCSSPCFIPSLITFLTKARSCRLGHLNLSSCKLTDPYLTALVDTWLVPYLSSCSDPYPAIDLSRNRLTETSINHFLQAVSTCRIHTPLSLCLTDNPITPSKVNEALLCHKGKNCVDSDCEFNKPVHAPLWRLMRVGGQEELQKVGEGKLVVCVGEEVGALFKPTNLLQERMGGKLKERVVLLLFDSAMRALVKMMVTDGAARYFMEVTLNNLAMEGVAYLLPEREKEEADWVVETAVQKVVSGPCFLLGSDGRTLQDVMKSVDAPTKEELLSSVVEQLSLLELAERDATILNAARGYLSRITRAPSEVPQAEVVPPTYDHQQAHQPANQSRPVQQYRQHQHHQPRVSTACTQYQHQHRYQEHNHQATQQRSRFWPPQTE